MPSLQQGHLQRSPPTSSSIPQHYTAAYPAGCTAHSQQQQPVGFVDERHKTYLRVADGLSENRLSIAHQMPGYPIQQQYRAQVYSYGSRAQQTNASISRPSQPPCGYSIISADPNYDHRTNADPNAHAPTRNPSTNAILPGALISHQISGDSTQGQGQYYCPGSIAYPQPPQTQTHGQPVYISPMHATPAEAFFLVNDPVSYILSYLAPAILTTLSEPPNHGPWPSPGVDISDEPTSPSRGDEPKNNDKKDKEQEPEPSQGPIPPAARKTRPVKYEGDLARLQQRCREKGADEGVVSLLGKIFADEVSLEALIRPLTDAEVETKEFGIKTGKIYTAFLEYTNEESVASRCICRLCHMHSKQTWKHSKDVLRHLRRDHFGLADVCKQWYVSNYSLTAASAALTCFPGIQCSDQKFYTKGELTRHPCKPLERTRATNSARS